MEVMERYDGYNRDLEKVISKIDRQDDFRADCFIVLGNLYFHNAVRATEKASCPTVYFTTTFCKPNL